MLLDTFVAERIFLLKNGCLIVKFANQQDLIFTKQEVSRIKKVLNHA